jgi:hypothetical protein
MRIHTHFNIDLDAAASVWAFTRFVGEGEVFFHPANWDGREMKEGEDVALDIEAGGQGLKGEREADGTTHSCFASLVKMHCSASDREALHSLVEFVDAQDRGGNAAEVLGVTGTAKKVLSATGINAVLRAFQALNPRDDKTVVEKMGEVFDGLLKTGRSRLAAEEQAATAEWVGGEVAIIENATAMSTNGVLMERGAKVVVFVDGNNIGAVRRSDVQLRLDHPAVKEVVAGEEGWFFHPAGFLAARGTRKAPATSKSVVEPQALAGVISCLLKE